MVDFGLFALVEYILVSCAVFLVVAAAFADVVLALAAASVAVHAEILDVQVCFSNVYRLLVEPDLPEF